MLQQLNEGIVYTYNTTQTAVASALRAEVPFIYADEAPPATPYPIITFENSAGSSEETFCSTLDVVSVDFKSFSNTSSESLELAYNIKKLYQNNLFPTDDGYTVLKSRYVTTFKTYDTVENKWVTTVEIQYTIESASDYGVTVPYTPEKWNSVYTTVNSNSANWGTGGGGVSGDYLPLSGGTMSGDITLDSNSLLDVSSVFFDTTNTGSNVEGELTWDTDEGTLSLGMPGDNVNLQLGSELLLPRRVNNSNAYDLPNGTLVYILTGGSGANIEVDWADNTSSFSSDHTIAMATEDIDSGKKGFATTYGLVRDLDTSSYESGTILYLGVSGGYTDIEPISPKHRVTIGTVFRSHASVGSVLVNIDNGGEISNLHDVLITNVQNDDTLIFNSSTGLWENGQLSLSASEVYYNSSSDPSTIETDVQEAMVDHGLAVYAAGQDIFNHVTNLSNPHQVTATQLDLSKRRYVGLGLVAPDAAVEVADNVVFFHVPTVFNDMDLVEVHAQASTAGVTGVTTLDVYNVTKVQSMLSTLITIDSGETGSDTAATPPVINPSTDNISTNDVIRIDVDTISTTAPLGMVITLGFE